jgi:hypothetical protein
VELASAIEQRTEMASRLEDALHATTLADSCRIAAEQRAEALAKEAERAVGDERAAREECDAATAAAAAAVESAEQRRDASECAAKEFACQIAAAQVGCVDQQRFQVADTTNGMEN